MGEKDETMGKIFENFNICKEELIMFSVADFLQGLLLFRF